MTSQGLSLLVPSPWSAIWIGLLIAFLVFGDVDRVVGPRNRALIALLMLAPVLADILGFRDGSTIRAWIFTAAYLITAGYAAWAASLGLLGNSTAWSLNLSRPALRAVVLILIALGAGVVFGRSPDDAGTFTNLGAQRWVETGTLPYGDPLLKGPDSPAFGGAATYGPVLYAAHIPFQILVGAERNPPDINPKDRAYRRPRALATQATCFAFYLIGLASLYVIVRRLAGEDLALGAVVLYAGSPYVLGLGGTDGGEYVVTGLAYVSHIAPAALMLAAMAMLNRPVMAGSLLALAAGSLYYPAFVFPLWLGWMLANRAGAARFTLGFVATGALIATLVVWFTHAPPGTNAMRLFVESTLEHQEGFGPRANGASTFGFWGTHPGLAAFWQTPLFGTTSLFKPTFMAYTALVVGSFFMTLARPRTVAQLAALTAMLTAGVQLWKTHAGGTYVEWYYPFLIIALLAIRPLAEVARTSEHAAAV